METIEQVIPVKKVILILISFFLFSCTDNKSDKLLRIIIEDLNTISNSKNINIDIRQDSVNSKFYFIIILSDQGFEKPYYNLNYKDYKIDILNNTKSFDLNIFNKYNLEYVSPKVEKYNVEKIDDSNQQTKYIYVINDSIVEKIMIFDIYGNMKKERIISKKW